MPLGELNTVALLSLDIRLAMANGESARAFQAGILLIQVLSLFGVSPRYQAVAEKFWKLIGDGVLRGLTDGRHEIRPSADLYIEWIGWLRARVFEIERLSGCHSWAGSDNLAWPTVVDALAPLLSLFANTSCGAQEELADLLEWTQPTTTPKARLEVVEKFPLFVRI
jgi:hypothetical protein